MYDNYNDDKINNTSKQEDTNTGNSPDDLGNSTSFNGGSVYSYGRDHNYYDKDDYRDTNSYGNNRYESKNSGQGYKSYEFTETVEPNNNNRKKPKKKPFGFAKVLMAGGLALVLGMLAGVGFQTVGYVSDIINPDKEIASVETGKDTAENIPSADNIATASTNTVTTVTDVSSVVDEVMPTVVSITNIGTQTINGFFGQQGVYESESSGSGIIIGENDTELLIVTNNHVVAGAETISVTFIDNATVEAQVKGTDADIDLAVLSIPLDTISEETASSIKIAVLGNSDSLKVGEPAIAIGNALGYGQSVTTGVISALNREVTVDNVTNELIQTDAAINPGNSGGALLNMEGELIGINAVKFASDEVEGMGYAIPISFATPIINELMNKETKTKVAAEESAYLGIAGVDVTQEVSTTYNMPVGVYVAQVVEGSAAEKAGLKVGHIITEFDGESVTSMEELQGLMEYYAAGESVEVKIQYMDSSELKEELLTVTLGKKTEAPAVVEEPVRQ